ncbi:hypothetical protein [Mangrovicoccus sp. HB161399]|uniref:hypothetical protein n=1 Tax=Mangrovicoccus sp. HB161399 TaxID=2720392 RepID=UPI001551D8BD|nr:hypothetical protein [Mangrovicoccus sp. HB161399]
MVQEIDRIYALGYIGLAIGFPLVFLLYKRAYFYSHVLEIGGGPAEYKAALKERAETDPVAKLSLRFLRAANLYFLFYWVSFCVIVGTHFVRGWWSYWG